MSTWASVFANALGGKKVKDLLSTVSAGGGAHTVGGLSGGDGRAQRIGKSRTAIW